MSPRVLLLIAAVVIAAITAKFILRARDTQPSLPASAQGSSASAGPESHSTQPLPTPPLPPQLPTAVPGDPASTFGEAPRPVLPPAAAGSGSGSGSGTPAIGAAAFAAEQRDDAWARPTEAELRKRLDPLGRTLVRSTECRAHQCELVLAGSESEVETALAFLESAKGLQTYARSILLTAPTRATDSDALELRAYAAFTH